MVRHKLSIVGNTNSKNARSEAARNRTRNPCALCQQDRKKCSGGIPCQRCLVERKKPEECKPGTCKKKTSFIIISGPSATDTPGTSVGSRPTTMDSQTIPGSSGFHSLPKETGAGSAAHGTEDILPSSALLANKHWLSSILQPMGVGSGAPGTYGVSRFNYGGSSSNPVCIQGSAGDTYGDQQQNSEWVGFQTGTLGQCPEYPNVAFNQQRDVRIRDRQVSKISESSVQQRGVSLGTSQQNMFAFGQGTNNSVYASLVRSAGSSPKKFQLQFSPPETVYPHPQPVVKHCDGQPCILNKGSSDLIPLFSTIDSFDRERISSNLPEAGAYQSLGCADYLADFPYYRQSGSNGDLARHR